MYFVICQGGIKGWYVRIVFMETPSFHICANVVDAMDGTTIGHTCLITVDKLFIVTSDLSCYNKEVTSKHKLQTYFYDRRQCLHKILSRDSHLGNKYMCI